MKALFAPGLQTHHRPHPYLKATSEFHSFWNVQSHFTNIKWRFSHAFYVSDSVPLAEEGYTLELPVGTCYLSVKVILALFQLSGQLKVSKEGDTHRSWCPNQVEDQTNDVINIEIAASQFN